MWKALLRGAAIAVLLMALAPFFVAWLETSGSIETDRKASSGQMIALSGGQTHYLSIGPQDGGCVILIHGVSGPMDVWSKIQPLLAEPGRRVIAFDLFGRGLSDRPDATYDRAFFRKQVLELADGLGCPSPIDLIGSSMGAIVAADTATTHPDRVRRVALVGPAGFPIEASPIAAFLQTPYLGEYIIAVFGKGAMVAHNKKYYVDASAWPDAMAAYEAQFRYPGYKRAILSTMRSMPVQNFRQGFAALGAGNTPVALIWGVEDKTFPHTFFDEAKTLTSPSVAVSIENAAHVPQYEQASAVAKVLNAFLAEDGRRVRPAHPTPQ